MAGTIQGFQHKLRNSFERVGKRFTFALPSTYREKRYEAREQGGGKSMAYKALPVHNLCTPPDGRPPVYDKRHLSIWETLTPVKQPILTLKKDSESNNIQPNLT